MNEIYKVYVKTNSDGYIIAIYSSAILSDTAGWVEIDSGCGDKYHHAQGNYFPKTFFTPGGAYRYKLVDGVPAECTAEEIAEQEAKGNPGTSSTAIEERVGMLEEELAFTKIILGVK